MYLHERINQLREQLENGNREECEQAAQALVEIGPVTIPALLLALKKNDRNSEWVEFESSEVKKALYDLGEPALLALLQVMKSVEFGRPAVKLLTRFKDERVAPALIDLVADEMKASDSARIYAINALAFELEDLRAVSVCIKAIIDRDKGVRETAVIALMQFYDLSPETVRHEVMQLGEPSLNLRLTAHEGLKVFGQREYSKIRMFEVQQKTPFAAEPTRVDALDGRNWHKVNWPQISAVDAVYMEDKGIVPVLVLGSKLSWDHFISLHKLNDRSIRAGLQEHAPAVYQAYIRLSEQIQTLKATGFEEKLASLNPKRRRR